MINKVNFNSFIVHEYCVSNKGLNKNTTIYLVEEIVNRPGILRISQFCQVYSEDEARDKLKRMISLRTYLGLSDRKGIPVGYLDEINTKAKGISIGDVEVVTEEDTVVVALLVIAKKRSRIVIDMNIKIL